MGLETHNFVLLLHREDGEGGQEFIRESNTSGDTV